MVFSSLIFLCIFLPLVIVIYMVCPAKFRNFFLLLASLLFYAWGEPCYILIMLFSTVFDYINGRLMEYFENKNQKRKRKWILLLSIVGNLGILFFFKYSNLLIQSWNQLTESSWKSLEIALPIGISFYTFQTMSYTIDVYRGDAKVQKNLITFGAYVSLFPQLIAGPIIRFKDVAEQLDSRKENDSLFCQGMIRFMAGLGKKVLIANQVGVLWKEISAMGINNLTTATAWLGILAFTLQIYFDFSGYSDMAIGLGAMFGFSFPENFNYPYESKSITEFWRRWHISLGTWFREYVYIPLGGNRKGRGRQIINLSIVWLLTGLWHGAYMNFVLWGIYYGVLLIIEKMLWEPVLKKIPSALQHAYTMLFVMFGWALFSWQDMADSAGYFKTMFFCGGAGVVDQQTMYLLSSNVLLLLAAIIGSLSVLKRIAEKHFFPEETVRRDVAGIFFIVVMFIACVAMLVNSSYNPFLYFRF